jgi:NDP-sugar pyrophosphorylase family protein
MMFPVAILAGGLATRLRPITESIPKALVDVAGIPFICRQLNYLRDQGVARVVICIGYRGDMIQAEVGDGSKYDLEVLYSSDGDELLGTGGALAKALPLLGDCFFVLYGDSFLPLNFTAVEVAFRRSQKPALMTVLKNESRWDRSNVHFQDGRIVEYNKRSPRVELQYIDYGLGILSASVLLSYPAKRAVFDVADVYHDLSVRGDLAGLEVHERFYEIGSHEGLKEAELYFLNRGE